MFNCTLTKIPHYLSQGVTGLKPYHNPLSSSHLHMHTALQQIPKTACFISAENTQCDCSVACPSSVLSAEHRTAFFKNSRPSRFRISPNKCMKCGQCILSLLIQPDHLFLSKVLAKPCVLRPSSETGGTLRAVSLLADVKEVWARLEAGTWTCIVILHDVFLNVAYRRRLTCFVSQAAICINQGHIQNIAMPSFPDQFSVSWAGREAALIFRQDPYDGKWLKV